MKQQPLAPKVYPTRRRKPKATHKWQQMGYFRSGGKKPS